MTHSCVSRIRRDGIAVAAAFFAMLAVAACGGGSGGGGGNDDTGDGTIHLNCNADASCAATFSVSDDVNTMEIAAGASSAGLAMTLDALGPGTYTYGEGIGDFGFQYQANDAATVIYLTWNGCTNDATVTLNAYSTFLTGTYSATLFGYNTIAHVVSCTDIVKVAGTINVARTAFTPPDSLGDTECLVNEDEICFVVNGGSPVTYVSGTAGDPFESSYNTDTLMTTIQTAMTDNIMNPDLTISFSGTAAGGFTFSAGTSDVLQMIGKAGAPPNIDSFFISNDDGEDDPANDCGASRVQVTDYETVGNRIIGQFVAELFEYDFDGSFGVPHLVYCNVDHRRVIYGAFNVERGADTSDD